MSQNQSIADVVKSNASLIPDPLLFPGIAKLSAKHVRLVNLNPKNLPVVAQTKQGKLLVFLPG